MRGLELVLPKIYRLLLPFALALSTIGCDMSEPPLRIGTNVWPGYEPIYLARELGYINRDRVQLVELLSATEVIRAYRNGALDVAALTLDEALLLRDSGVAAQVLLISDTSYGADAILARTGERLFDLKGKRIGVETSALGAYVLSRALSVEGLSTADVEVVALEVNQHEEAFIEGGVEALVTFEPVRSRLIAGGATELFSSREIPDEVIDVLVVRPEVIEDRPEQVKALLDAWFEGVDYLAREPEKSYRLMSARLGLTPDQMFAAFAGLRIVGRKHNRDLIYAKPSPLLRQAERMGRVMTDHQLLTRPVDLRAFVVPEDIWE
ncbi:MAG: ABC transporter substrate-binding protein [Oceanospirillales bacterium]|nr:ABC transporter substrate-binding protein [Oceanospirillales bacterium]